LALSRTRLPALAVVLCLGGCAAARVTPVAMVQPGDDELSCQAIADQIQSNTTAEQRFLAQDKEVGQMNAVKTVVPYMGGTIDLSNSEQVQARALADRNERLGYLANSKGCKQ
jgi:hypothetical protein